MYANVDTLSKVKKCEIEELIKQESPDLICICEIFPKNPFFEVTKEQYNIDGYYLHITGWGRRGIAVNSRTEMEVM